MQIVQGSEVDLPQILQIEQDTFPLDSFDENTIINLIQSSILFLKVISNSPDLCLGYTICTRFEEKQIGKKSRIAELASIAIIPSYQGLGYGHKLMTKIISELELNNISVIRLQVDVHNERAIKLYTDFGFHIKKRIFQYYSESKHDAYLMIKKRATK